MTTTTFKPKISWTCKNTWKKASYNTSWCLLGCAIGDLGTIAFFQYTGIALVYATIKDTSSNHSIIAKLLGTPKINKGDQVSFQIQKGKMHLFDEEGRRYLNGKK